MQLAERSLDVLLSSLRTPGDEIDKLYFATLIKNLVREEVEVEMQRRLQKIGELARLLDGAPSTTFAIRPMLSTLSDTSVADSIERAVSNLEMDVQVLDTPQLVELLTSIRRNIGVLKEALNSVP